MDTDFTSELKQLTENLVFYSESEHQVDVIYLPINDSEEIIPFIAEYVQCAEADVVQLAPEDFFQRFHNYIGGDDKPMEENSFKFLSLYKYLQEHTKSIFVYRVERANDAFIPVFIVCQSGEDTFAALEMLAEET